MPMLPVKRAKLHTDIFVAGKNLKESLDKKEHRHNLHMEYCREHQELHVTYNLNGVVETVIVPATNIVCMAVGESEHEPVPAVQQAAVKMTAQVSSPQGHVFAGPGAGKTGKDK